MLDKAEEKQVVTDLIVHEPLDIEKVFTKKGMDTLLQDIKTQVESYVFDPTTDEGRKNIISLAFKVSRSKTFIVGKSDEDLASMKQKIKDRKVIIDHAKDFLDNLRDDTRKPVTDWEIEQESIKAEEEARQKVIVEKRIKELLAVEVVMSFIDVATMTDEEFNELLMGKTLEFEEAQKLKAIKEAEQKAEAERLAKQKAEQEAEAKKLAEQNAKLEAEQKAIEDQKKSMRTDMMLAAGFELENDTFYFVGFMDFSIPMSDIMEVPSTMFKNHVLSSKAEAEKQMKESAELAEKERKAEAKAKAEHEAKEAEEKRIAAENEAKRQEELKPDKQKLHEWIAVFDRVDNNPAPRVKSDEAKELLDELLGDLGIFLQESTEKIEEL